jgi:chromosome condensin MukBEF MukE localization factor
MSADAPVPATDEEIERTMFSLLERRAPSSSVCPSDVARALAGEEHAWRVRMRSMRLRRVGLFACVGRSSARFTALVL